LRHNKSNSPQFGLEKKKEKVYLSGISTNTSRVCSPPAAGAADAAALIAANEPFFIGVFTAGTFAIGFMARFLGMGGVFAVGRTDVVDGAPVTKPIAAATGPGGTTCVPICFLFAPTVAVGTVPPVAPGAQHAAVHPVVAAGAGRASTTGGCGAAMGA
jgi:hypothetical protein